MAPSSLQVRLKFTDGFPIPAMEDRDEVKEEQEMLMLLDRTALSIRARGVYPLPDGVKVTFRREEDVDRFMTEKCKKMLLQEMSLIPFVSPEKLANQTIVIYTRSPLIHSSTEDQLKREVKEQHEGITVISIWKDRRLGVIKITCRTNEEAETLRSKELKLRGYTLMPEDLVKAYYIPIQQCLRCYRLGSHTSSACKDDKIYCGECGAQGHRHTDCKANFTACINCIRANAPPETRKHNARSNTCPLKKKLLAKERRKLRGRSETPAGRPPVNFEDAPPPKSNAWTGQQANRSVSRSRRNRKGSRSSRQGSTSIPPGRRPALPNAAPPSESTSAYPDLAHNAKERNKKKKKKKGNPSTSTNQMEQSQLVSAQLTAGSEVEERGYESMEHDELEGALARAGYNPAPLPVRRETFSEALHMIETERSRPALATRPSNINEINIILTASHHHNVTRPGEFNKRANELFRRAKLPAVDLGDEWHSEEFLAAISSLGSNENTTKNVNRSCNCSCKEARSNLQTRSLGTNTEKIECETKEQRQRRPSRTRPELPTPPPPLQLTLDSPDVVAVDSDGMETQSQGVKRTRVDSPTELENLKRRYKELKPTSPKTVSTPSSSEDEQDGTIVETPVPESWEEMVDDPEPIASPNETIDFADAQSTFSSVDVPVISTPTKTGTQALSIDNLPEIPVPEKKTSTKKMPPPALPQVPRSKDRSSLNGTNQDSEERPRTPRNPRPIPDDTQGNTPLKRTSSELVLHKPLPSGPTYSQLDRAMEEACDEERKKQARKHQRNSSIGKAQSSTSNSSTRRGLDKLNMIKQVIAADHIARSKLRITTANPTLQQGLLQEVTTISVPKLIQLWKQGSLVIEVVPRTRAENGKEPQWRRDKYATLTRTLYEERIEAKEWEKHRRKLLISVEDPSKVTMESQARRRDEVNLKVLENTRLHRDLAELETFFGTCEPSPIKNSNKEPISQNPDATGNVDFFSSQNSYKNSH